MFNRTTPFPCFNDFVYCWCRRWASFRQLVEEIDLKMKVLDMDGIINFRPHIGGRYYVSAADFTVSTSKVFCSLWSAWHQADEKRNSPPFMGRHEKSHWRRWHRLSSSRDHTSMLPTRRPQQSIVNIQLLGMLSIRLRHLTNVKLY